jgi:hypothetical protein
VIFAGFGRRLVLLHLVHVQGDSDKVDASDEELHAVFDIAGHVDARWVMVAQVDDDGRMPV